MPSQKGNANISLRGLTTDHAFAFLIKKPALPGLVEYHVALSDVEVAAVTAAMPPHPFALDTDHNLSFWPSALPQDQSSPTHGLFSGPNLFIVYPQWQPPTGQGIFSSFTGGQSASSSYPSSYIHCPPYMPSTNSSYVRENLKTFNETMLSEFNTYNQYLTPADRPYLIPELDGSPAVVPGGLPRSTISLHELNRSYLCCKVQSVHAAVPASLTAVICRNMSQLVLQYSHFDVEHLTEMAHRHKLQISSRKSALIAILTSHQCSAACAGFESQDGMTAPGYITCKLSDVQKFVALYDFLNINQLTTLADIHRVDADQSKPALKRAISLHVCSAACPNLSAMFTRRLHARPGPFGTTSPLAIPPPRAQHSSCTITDLNVLPVLVNNNMQVDASDGPAHASMYLLNCSYNFVEIVSPVSLQTLHVADVGVKFIAVHTTSIGDLVSMYGYFTKTQCQQLKRDWPSSIAHVAYVLTTFVGKTRGSGDANPYESM
ncbi:hypothetical protein K438DRAFT_1773377 [Mycena galopus ATCC 62051]|nr:hypothetical protein K438DRAFT_1773377 [Mycena galopus ATCC 62051]